MAGVKGRSGKNSRNGGAKEGAGRPPGKPNPSTLEFRQHAREFTHEAIEFFVGVMRNYEAPLTLRMEAANWLCDRGHGKPVIQASIEHEANMRIDFEPLRTRHDGARDPRSPGRAVRDRGLARPHQPDHRCRP
jgi:hypothetical protein